MVKLSKIGTEALIGQYDLAISSYAGRITNSSPRQRRINMIVDILTDRADDGDALAIAWFAS